MADNTPGRENTPRQSGLSWSQPSSAPRQVPSSTTSSTNQKYIASPARPAAVADASTSRRGMLLFSTGVIVGGLLAWSWFSLMSDGPVSTRENGGSLSTNGAAAGAAAGATSSGATGASPLPGTTIGSESLVVPNPQEAGVSARIGSATVTAPTWVVIYESYKGVRGNALGAAMFFPENNNTNKTIKLLRAMAPNRTYFVGRHVDNGDKKFSTTLDKPIVNAAGNPVYVEFRTQ